MISVDDVGYLQTDAAAQLINFLNDDALTEQNTLRTITRLRERVTPQQAGAILQQARLRAQAAAKFGEDAAHMLFTPDALQQASDPQIRAYRAASVAGQRVVDVGCGIGADTIALARAGCTVTALEIDPVRVMMARHNLRALGLSGEVLHHDATEGIPSGFDAAFFDPARRDEQGRRIFDVNEYQPPLHIIHDWNVAQIMVKLSPGVDLAQLHEHVPQGSVEFISVEGDLKEAVLHLPAKSAGATATRIDAQGVHTFYRTGIEPDVLAVAPRGWLLEPDPAILRAGLVRDLAAVLDARMLDPTIAYLWTHHRPRSPWVRTWRIRDVMPFNLKRLRRYLQQYGVRHITAKKRGFPMTPDELINRLKLKKGDGSATLVLTRVNDELTVLICDDITHDSP